jgi:hypothetical protein
MAVKRLLTAVALTVAAALTTSCGGSSDAGGQSARPTTPPSSVPTTSETASSETASTPTSEAPDTAADIAVLGGASSFEAGGGSAEPLQVDVAGRECVLSEPLFGSCRGATGAGGAFVVTAEGDPDSVSTWTVVARCGLAPAAAGASASGTFTPVMADLGLAPYGEVAGVTLLGPDHAEAALVYQPQGAACPTVWGLGEVDRASLFTGGTDALNGEESALRFRDATGAEACAVADGQGGIMVGTPDGEDCRG